MRALVFAFLLLPFAASASPELDAARVAYERGEYAHAQAKLLVAARAGEREAQEMLGYMLALGPALYPGVRQDIPAAVTWLQRAAGSRHATPKYVHCALLRKKTGRPLAELDCFHDLPPALVPTAAH